MGFRVFGVILILLGGYITYGVIGSCLPIMFGDQVKAKIIRMDSEKLKKHKPNSPIVYYPVLQFEYQNETITLTNNFQHDFKKNFIDTHREMTIYYSKNHGVSNGFTVVEGVFLFMGFSFLFFGLIALFKSK